ncbi:MAG TPA: helix-turn-helix transcriptional regulator [Thermoanaerobaculia bacterium]
MEVTEFETLGGRLARLRRMRGLRQKDLADRIGATVQRVSRYENDRYMPRVETLAQLAGLLDVSVEFLLTGRSSPVGDAAEDHRLRERLPALERLPQPYLDGLVLFLDALLASYYQSEKPSPPAGKPGEPEGAP